MRVYLSGMPELRLGLNDKVLFESTGRKCSFILIAEAVLIMFALYILLLCSFMTIISSIYVDFYRW